MQWSELYDGEHEPSSRQIAEFVETPLWGDLTAHLEDAYHARKKLSYSNCSMDKGSWKGWNAKFQKSGKALCTLYPRQGYFVALIVVGAKELAEADLLIPSCDAYTKALYDRTKPCAMGKWLPIEVTNKSILRDVKRLAALRVGTKKG